jgi:hypothetical protein
MEYILANEEFFFTEESEGGHQLISYALCHVYHNHKIITAKTEEIFTQSIKAQETEGILFPIFKASKIIQSTYIEKHRPFLYRCLPGRTVMLNYKVDGEDTWRAKQMLYWRFGVYLVHIPHFYNERLTYYFSEEMSTGSITTRQEEIHNSEMYMDNKQIDPFFVINNAVIYEQMFKYEQVESTITGMVKDVRLVISELL